ncbi:hypothetical protein ESZ39_03900 [Colwellia sp. C1TZA3]|nr:hypothetical protein ESZ39_03900 [Colwellia sp. C1TZA3]
MLLSIPIASYCSIERLTLSHFSCAQQDHKFNGTGIIPITLSYCSLVLVKIAQGCVALNPNSQLLLNRAPYLELFFLRTTRSQT